MNNFDDNIEYLDVTTSNIDVHNVANNNDQNNASSSSASQNTYSPSTDLGYGEANNINNTQSDSQNTNTNNENNIINNEYIYQNTNQENYEEKPLPPKSYVIKHIISIIIRVLAVSFIGIALVYLFVAIPLSGLNVNNKTTASDFIPVVAFLIAGIVLFIISILLRQDDKKYDMRNINRSKNLISKILSIFWIGSNMYKEYNRYKRK